MANPTDEFDIRDVALWPQYPDPDPADLGDGQPPRAWSADKAWGSITTNRVLVDRTVDQREGRRTKRRRVIIRCAPAMHQQRRAPRLAEIWSTDYGLVFAARVLGRAGDPQLEPDDYLAPPTAVLTERQRQERLARLGRIQLGNGDRLPVPVVGIRVLLPCAAGERLFVKCGDCGPVELDPERVMRHAITAAQAAQGNDAGSELSITVLDVAQR